MKNRMFINSSKSIERQNIGDANNLLKSTEHITLSRAEAGEQDKDPNAIIDALYKSALETNFEVGNCNRKK